jgi:Mg-chelatase subunit ChlD
VDVLPVSYRYDREVLFKRVALPPQARSGQTVPVRLILQSTHDARGRLFLNLNGQPVDLNPSSENVEAVVTLKSGTNVKTVSIPLGSRGVHRFEAFFEPFDPADDLLEQNNRAAGVTYVRGPGHVLVVDPDGRHGMPILQALRRADIDARAMQAERFPESPTDLMNVDAVLLVNTDRSLFNYRQQEMLCRFVGQMGGGLMMIGGPDALGAGGWIGSPVAEIAPVDFDPPQRKEMPLGALVLVIDRSSSMTGQKLKISKTAAVAAVRGLSRRDYVAVVTFDSQAELTVPLRLAANQAAIGGRIRQISIGGGTDVHAGMRKAHQVLNKKGIGVKHVILLTDGQTAGPPCRGLAKKMAGDRITISTVAVGMGADRQLLSDIARTTKGRYYAVDDPRKIPQIFVKEAQVIRRALIIEDSFTPKITSSLSETIRGLGAMPKLDGYVLTGPKGGLNQVVLESAKGDPILATGHFGLGRVVVFASSADSRWANQWLGWDGFDRFWEQTVRWAAKPGQPGDLEVFADIEGKNVTLTVEASGQEGPAALSGLAGQTIAPDMTAGTLPWTQTGPGQFRGSFEAGQPGSYLVNLSYGGKGAASRTFQAVINMPFASEYEDLTDNLALLSEVADLTGGRVLPVRDPDAAALFDPATMSFPKTALPLTRPFFLVWVVLFLLDVASRRIAVDWRALWRRAAARLPLLNRKARKGGATIDALRIRRQKLREKLRKRAAPAAGRRFEAQAGDETELPVETAPEPDKPPPPPQRKPPAPAKPEAEQPQTHVGRLLQRKKQARKKLDK